MTTLLPAVPFFLLLSSSLPFAIFTFTSHGFLLHSRLVYFQYHRHVVFRCVYALTYTSFLCLAGMFVNIVSRAYLPSIFGSLLRVPRIWLYIRGFAGGFLPNSEFPLCVFCFAFKFFSVSYITPTEPLLLLCPFFTYIKPLPHRT